MSKATKVVGADVWHVLPTNARCPIGVDFRVPKRTDYFPHSIYFSASRTTYIQGGTKDPFHLFSFQNGRVPDLDFSKWGRPVVWWKQDPPLIHPSIDMKCLLQVEFDRPDLKPSVFQFAFFLTLLQNFHRKISLGLELMLQG